LAKNFGSLEATPSPRADEERQRIEGIVKVAARRCGVTGPNRYRGTPPADGRATTTAPGAGTEGEGGPGESGRQLRLL